MRALYLAATIFCLSVASAPVQASHRQSSCYPQHKFVEWPRHQRNEWLPCGGRHVSRHGWSHHLRRHYARVHNPRTGRGVSVSREHFVKIVPRGLHGLMRVADSQGGHCGLWTEWTLLGRLEHVLHDAIGRWNPWLADDWMRHFPRTAPAPGTAAVWPHRHVAPVLAVHNDGTVTVRDSWAVHRVRVAGLVFVQPPVERSTFQQKRSSPEKSQQLMRWPSGALS